MMIGALTPPAILDLVAGRWRSQIIHAGVALGVFEHLSETASRSSAELAGEIGADGALLYRLLRALACVGLLLESDDKSFKISPGAGVLRGDHPHSLRALVLLEEGPVHYEAWRNLPEMVRSGVPDGFQREFGMKIFEYFRHNASYAAVFQQAMSSYSAVEGHAIARLLAGRLQDKLVLCDIGGGYGSLLAELMRDRPDGSGIVFDVPQVSAEQEKHETRTPDLAGRIVHAGGDMFQAVPSADAYFLKHILHDWNDDECTAILTVARRAANPQARLFICELVVPGPSEPHFAKLFDIHMLCISPGQQRTAAELESLLAASGWRSVGVHALEGSPMSVLEAVPA
jgi:hypothetical protein